MTDDGYDLDAALETAAERTKAAERESSASPRDADASASDPAVEPQEVLSDEALADRVPPRGAGDNRDESADR